MDGEPQNEEYQNDTIAEKFFHTGEVHSVHENTDPEMWHSSEPETADQGYENDNRVYEYIKYSDMRMRKLPEVGVKRDSVLFASKRGQWGDIRRRHFIAFSFLLFLSLILAITALVLACLRCFSECPHDWKKLDEKCYYFSSEPNKWAVARSHCQNLGADLVVIDSEREWEFLDYKMDKSFWIGLFYEEDEEAWKWVNDKNEFYLNWDRNMVPEKDRNGHGKYCMIAREDQRQNWNNIECLHRRSYICEKSRHVACVLKSPVLPF